MSKRSSSDKNDCNDNNKNPKYDSVSQKLSGMKSSKLFKLNEEQKQLFEYVVSEKSFSPIFVSGPVGTGKRTLIKYMTKYLKNDMKEVWVVSGTNIGAREVGGRTIHSTFRFDLKLNTSDPEVENNPDYLIIHDITTVSAMLLHKMDEHLRSNRNYNDARGGLPFGGVKTIAFGDLYNLLLINNGNYDVNAIYDLSIWNSFRLFKLTLNMRESEDGYIEALRKIRVGDEAGIPFFNRFFFRPKCTKNLHKDTYLVATHDEADAINDYYYQNVSNNHEGPEYKNELELKNIGQPFDIMALFLGSENAERSKDLDENSQNSENSEEAENSDGSKISEEMDNCSSFEKSEASENSEEFEISDIPDFVYEEFQEKLKFKKGINFCIGTRVMITMNVDSFCNGDIGEIVKIDEDGQNVWVKREYDETILKLTRVTCYFNTPKLVKKNKKMFTIVRKITGFPMIHAWAITIHKAKGMTFKNLIVRPREIWSREQLYVALSSVAHCDGLRLLESVSCPREWPHKQDVEKAYDRLKPLFQGRI